MRAPGVFLSGCVLVQSAYAALFTVGDTVQDACDFATIQEAIDAAAANGPVFDQILVANTGDYANQALQIGDQSLVIEGGYDSCLYQAPASAADIGGNGFDPVLRIAPEDAAKQYVTLYGLRLHGGGIFGVFGSSGGGIYVTNNVTLTIGQTSIDNNGAASGGGIYIDGITGPPTVELDAGTQIHDNHAQYYGGGIYLESGQLDIEADQVHIDYNRSDTDGGGIASFGGTVFVGSFGTVAARYDAAGASVSHNTAGAAGGGVSLAGASAALIANELIVDSNTAAVSGGGIVASAHATVSMARDYPGSFVLQCPNARECSRLGNNRLGAQYGTVGGALALYSGAFANIAQTIVRDNVALDGSVAYVEDATLFLEGVLATGNQSFDQSGQGSAAIFARNPTGIAKVRIAYSTFAGNLEQASPTQNITAIDVIAKQGAQVSVFSSAFFDSYLPIITYDPYTDDCVVNGPGGRDGWGSHSRFSTPADSGFNAAAAGDFRLRSESPLNDYCDSSAFVASFRDLVLTPRCHDDPRKGNAYGTCDVGAYESDQIFGNGLQ
jgi:hypothetical protein